MGGETSGSRLTMSMCKCWCSSLTCIFLLLFWHSKEITLVLYCYVWYGLYGPWKIYALLLYRVPTYVTQLCLTLPLQLFSERIQSLLCTDCPAGTVQPVGRSNPSRDKVLLCSLSYHLLDIIVNPLPHCPDVFVVFIPTNNDN